MNILQKEFGDKKQWCNWRLEMKDGDLTKVPYFSRNIKASSSNPSKWNTFQNVEKAFADTTNKFTGIGLFFTLNEKLLGIDLDSCLENGIIHHEKKQEIESFIKQSDTYTEISPSGTGLHLFLKLTDSLTLVANKEPKALLKTARKSFEVYTSGRYFTVTNKSYGQPTPIRTVTTEEALSLLSIIGYPWSVENKPDLPVVSIPNNLEDTEILQKMFASKIGNEMKTLYNGDISAYKGDESSADYALCGSLAFWTGKNASQIERIWLSSPLGSRDKTKVRADYRAITIKKAISKCTNVYTPVKPKVKKEGEIEFLYTLNKEKDKVYVVNTENICRVLREHSHFHGHFRYDAFKNIYEILPSKSNKWRTIEDNDAVNIQTAIQVLFPAFYRVGKDMVYDAIIKVAKENTFDSASDFILSLTWDRTARLDEWLINTYGTPDDVYHRAVGSNWVKGLVSRIITPGCKFDYVLVLEGEQGGKKSTSLSVLGGDWHVETTMSTDTKDFFMQFQGKAIIEFSEGETLSRTEVKRMKAIITMQSDKYRPPYERSSQDFARRCVFAMTTNQTEYLKDETGNRRWLPVAVLSPEADIEWLKTNRNQLLAEAYHRVFVLQETIYEFPKEETIKAQQMRQIADPNEDLIKHWYFVTLAPDKRAGGITVHQVYRDVLHSFAPSKPMSKFEEMSIAGVLKTIGLDKRQISKDGVRTVRWFDKQIASPVEIKQTAQSMADDILNNW